MTANSQNGGILLPAPEDMPRDSNGFFRWLGFFLKPYARTLLLFFGIRVFRYAVLYVLPLAIGLVIKAFETGWAFDHPQQLILGVGAYMALYLVTLFSIGIFIGESTAQDKMIRGMTMFSIRHINSLPLDWHESQGSGGKLQRVMTARSSLKGLIDIYKWSIVPFIGAILAIGFSVAVMEAPAWFMLLYLGFSASFIGVAFYVARPLPELHNRHNALLEKLLSGVYEFVSAVRTVKSFNMARYIEERANEYETEGHGAWRTVLKTIFRKWMALNTIAGLWMCIFLAVCISGVYSAALSIGAFATLFYLAYDLWKTLENLVYIQDQYIEYRAGFMRLTETLKARARALDLAPVQPLARDWRILSLDGVDFNYGDGKSHALTCITLSIRRGEKVALVGPSGAGKSTLAKLLMKQMWPESGTIAVDATDLRHVSSEDWLGQIGIVPQDVELFNMSIRDNILLDRVDTIDETAYRAALHQAALDSFIDSLPDGDATLIGERGIKLSGGQRQRLGIARALVRQAELIIFDEATSSLDSLSEQAIQEAIEKSFAGKTLVVIAHRLSTVRHVDRIFVLQEGRLAEQGGFRDLVKKNGTFARMWALQSDSFAAEQKAAAL